jgi:hypothetical protein
VYREGGGALLFIVTVDSEGLLFWVAFFIFLRLIPLTSCYVIGLVFSVMSSSIASSVVVIVVHNWF